jgi:hypothetical protein
MHTEEEARKLWCPMVRYEEGVNRWSLGAEPLEKWGTEDNPSASRCIASQCMMWRWERDLYAEGYQPESNKGYCGIANKP